MKVHFFSKIGDEITNFITDGFKENNVLSFYEKNDNMKILVNVVYHDDYLEIIRDGDVSSNFVFKLNETTKATYELFNRGTSFDVLTNKLDISENKIYIEYTTIFDELTKTEVKLWIIIK